MTIHKNMTPEQRVNKSEGQKRRWKSEKYRYFERVLAQLKFTAQVEDELNRQRSAQ